MQRHKQNRMNSIEILTSKRNAPCMKKISVSSNLSKNITSVRPSKPF
jgi:hypothetical protein